ncbi:hypothetical protein SH1V18_14890 [Vallitalea longa]|uniref:Phage tail tape measure protein domain-containing protein n=1 Tax=Vallitalea longa TaxID=2936439 RepID=A0A9W5Y9G2_9FIRM|nr:phage tail tape measure protein [Vallitalea longa]GKX29009.1 hypothetical protein SH1V18_14890 [Vallitalea longa]
MNKEFQTIIKVGMNATDFNKNSSEVSRRIKLLDTSFREASARAKAYGESTDTLKQKHTILTEKINLQTQRVQKLKHQYEKSRKETGDNSKATDTLAIRYNNAIIQLRRIEGQLDKTNKNIKEQSKALTEVQQKMKDYGDRVKKVGEQANEISNGMLKVGAAITAVGAVVTKIGIDFDTSMRKVKTIADETQVSNKQLSDSVLELSSKYGIANTEIANSLYETLSAGVETKKSISFLDDAIKNSIGGFTDATTSVNTLTNILNAYNVETEKSIEISDKLLVLQKLGKTTIGEFGDQIGKVAPLASQANVNIDELLGSIATLTKNSIKGKESITAMKAVISNIIKPSVEASIEANRLGMKFNAAGLKAKGFAGFLDMVIERTHGNTESLTKLFGSVEALNAVMLLTSDKGAKDFKEALDAMADSTGMTDEAVKDMDGSGRNLDETIQTLKNSATEAFYAIEPILTTILNILNPIFKAFSNINPIILRFITIFGIMLVVIGSFIKLAGTLAISIGAISATMGTLGITCSISASHILIVVGALAALAFILALVLGRSKDVSKGIEDVTNSVSNMKLPQPEVPKEYVPKQYSVNGSHRNGLKTVPFDGYKAELHKNEEVLTASDPRNINNDKKYGGDNFYITIDTSNIKDINDIVEIARNARQNRRQYA